jgi:DNA-binding transcriptional MerR regulator
MILEMMKEYSTAQVARKLGVGRDTLHRWFREGLRAPRKRQVGGVTVRIWSNKDLERARKYKAARYRKGRGRRAVEATTTE